MQFFTMNLQITFKIMFLFIWTFVTANKFRNYKVPCLLIWITIIYFLEQICPLRNNQFSKTCGVCPKNCQNLNQNTCLLSTFVLYNCCICNPGYVFLNGDDGDCVKPEECPKWIFLLEVK